MAHHSSKMASLVRLTAAKWGALPLGGKWLTQATWGNWGFTEVRGGERKESGYPQQPGFSLAAPWRRATASLLGCGCAVLGRAVPPGDSFLESAGSEAAFFAFSRIQQAEGVGTGGWG